MTVEVALGATIPRPKGDKPLAENDPVQSRPDESPSKPPASPIPGLAPCSASAPRPRASSIEALLLDKSMICDCLGSCESIGFQVDGGLEKKRIDSRGGGTSRSLVTKLRMIYWSFFCLQSGDLFRLQRDQVRRQTTKLYSRLLCFLVLILSGLIEMSHSFGRLVLPTRSNTSGKSPSQSNVAGTKANICRPHVRRNQRDQLAVRFGERFSRRRWQRARNQVLDENLQTQLISWHGVLQCSCFLNPSTLCYTLKGEPNEFVLLLRQSDPLIEALDCSNRLFDGGDY